ncbi:hypothetical protein [Rhizobium tumorigenes]|uniref:Integrase catalytic domain-containing protein n=2 Tax=Rhizobium tumorigenes TaxID=2041385 RepID=A0AAF1KAG5_9HYPH|nr:hypothetical protein [Rhizobium tumorigenes]WFR97594.1 hypothetical protein PR017_20540 [Rhizobium tumorigenes]
MTGMLEIPPPGEREGPAQPFDLPASSRFEVLSPSRRICGDFAVVSARIDAKRGRVLLCQSLTSGEFVELSDWQLAELDRENRLKLPTAFRKGLLAGSAISLTPGQEAEAKRNRGYVKAAVDLAWEEGKDFPTTGTFERAIAIYAEEIEDKEPLTTATVRKYWNIWRKQSAVDLSVFVKAVSTGKTDGDYTKEFEELVRDCLLIMKSSQRPILADFKVFLITVLKEPEHRHLYDEVVDGNGNLRPSKTWFYNRLGDLNRYDALRLEVGPEAAKNAYRHRAARIPPLNCLDIVDVDYAELNVIAFDNRYRFVYGRPKLILFRDRATGSVLGYAVFFGNESFDAVWHGFKRSIFPKDMRRYPKWLYPMYGYPCILIVDNAATLISAAVMKLGDDLGIKVFKARVYRPTDKAGVEQFFGKQDRQVIHNLPGSVEKSPKDRDRFDDEKNKGVPYIDMDQLDAKIMQFICTHVHARPLSGFRRGAETSTDLWNKSIMTVKNRTVIIYDELVRTAGAKADGLRIRGGNTIVHNWLMYTSDDLLAISAHPSHRERETEEGRGRRILTVDYKGHLDPSDISVLFVENPYDRNSVVAVPICEADREYATGRTRLQHEAAIQHHNRVMKTAITGVSDLERAAARMDDDQKDMVLAMKTKRPREEFLAWFSDLKEKTELGRVVDVTTSASVSSDYLDPENPFEPPEVNRSPTAAPRPGGETPDMIWIADEHGELQRSDPLAVAQSHTALPHASPDPGIDHEGTDGDEDFDVEALRRRHEGWN